MTDARLILGVEGTTALAHSLAARLPNTACLCLKGDLGAGKTTFTQALIRQWTGSDIAIISPTFNILQTYDVLRAGKKIRISHFDLYRLEDVSELYDIGLEDALEQGITIIEWPEIAERWLPKNRFELIIEFAESSENRFISLIEPEMIKA